MQHVAVPPQRYVQVGSLEQQLDPTGQRFTQHFVTMPSGQQMVAQPRPYQSGGTAQNLAQLMSSTPPPPQPLVMRPELQLGPGQLPQPQTLSQQQLRAVEASRGQIPYQLQQQTAVTLPRPTGLMTTLNLPSSTPSQTNAAPQTSPLNALQSLTHRAAGGAMVDWATSSGASGLPSMPPASVAARSLGPRPSAMPSGTRFVMSAPPGADVGGSPLQQMQAGLPASAGPMNITLSSVNVSTMPRSTMLIQQEQSLTSGGGAQPTQLQALLARDETEQQQQQSGAPPVTRLLPAAPNPNMPPMTLRSPLTSGAAPLPPSPNMTPQLAMMRPMGPSFVPGSLVRFPGFQAGAGGPNVSTAGASAPQLDVAGVRVDLERRLFQFRSNIAQVRAQLLSVEQAVLQGQPSPLAQHDVIAKREQLHKMEQATVALEGMLDSKNPDMTPQRFLSLLRFSRRVNLIPSLYLLFCVYLQCIFCIFQMC